MKPIIDLSGKTFGYWKVIQLDEQAPSGRGHSKKWICRCKCGVQKSVNSSHLRNGFSTQCRKCGSQKEKHIMSHLFGCYKLGAENRKIIFSITMDEMLNLIKKQNFQCALSKLPIKIVNFKGKFHETTASLDRIDSSKGYTINNVQWVHKDINFMKQEYSQDYFIYLCKLVAST